MSQICKGWTVLWMPSKQSKLPQDFLLKHPHDQLSFHSDFILPPRSSCWDAIPVMPSSSIVSVTRGLEVINSPMSLASLPPNPTNDDNRDAWTECQRELASKAIIPKDLKELQDLV